MTVNSGYGFPYPLSSEPVANGAANIQSLASAVDSKMGLFKIIPTGATNGSVTSDGDVTINSAVSSVTVSGAFSSLFDAYRIIVSGGSASTSVEISIRLGSVSTNYKWGIVYSTYVSAAALAIVNNSAASFQYVGRATSSTLTMDCTLRQPNLAKPTFMTTNYVAEDAQGTSNGIQTDLTAFSDFTIFPQLGTLTGGTIRVYGFRA